MPEAPVIDQLYKIRHSLAHVLAQAVELEANRALETRACSGGGGARAPAEKQNGHEGFYKKA